MPDQHSAASEHAIIQEITAPLETLPDDPLALVEADFPTAMRGYDRHAVDDYVEQMTRLVAELHATRSPEAAVRRALERVGDQISGVLQRAHQTAEQITAQSRMEADDRLERARREGRAMIEAAERRVRELDADADRVWAERARIIADAEALSGQLLAVARDAAGRFPAEETRPAPITDHLGDLDVGSQAGAEPYPAEDPRAAEDPHAADDPYAVEEPLPTDDEPFAAEDPTASEPAGAEEHEPLDAPQAPAVEERPGDDPAIDPPQTAGDPAAGDRAAGEGEDAGEDEDDDAGPAGRLPVEDPTVPIDPTEQITRLSTDDDSTRIIPPASDAAQRRRET